MNSIIQTKLLTVNNEFMLDTKEFMLCVKMYSIMGISEFSSWLQEEMNKKGWSQSDLARAAGVTRGSIGNVLREERKPGNDLCLAIALAFNIPPEEVFRRAGLLPPKDDEDEKLLEELNFKLSQLPPDLQEDALRYLDFLLDKQEQKARGNNLDLKRPLDAPNTG